MKYGYIRVSETGLAIEQQTRLLLEVDCDRLFTDLTREGRASQDAFQEMLNMAKSGDTVIVAKLDRLPGGLKQVLQTLTTLFQQGTQFVSLADHINTQVNGFDLVMTTLSALLAFDHDRQNEKNKLGLHAARARGKLGGRPRKMDKSRVGMAKSLYKDKKHSIDDICGIMGVSRATLYRYLK